MDNYRQIGIEEFRNYKFIEKQLKAGYIIIKILINNKNKEISELTSYANDKCAKSYYTALVESDLQLKNNVITEYLYPYYAYKDENKTPWLMCADIDIYEDSQNVISFEMLKLELKSAKDFLDEDFYFEFFISTEKDEVSNFGGPLELDFIEDWMTEKGYYVEGKNNNDYSFKFDIEV